MSAPKDNDPEALPAQHSRDIRITAGQRTDKGAYHSRPKDFPGGRDSYRPTHWSQQNRGLRVYDPIGGTWTRDPVKDGQSRATTPRYRGSRSPEKNATGSKRKWSESPAPAGQAGARRPPPPAPRCDTTSQASFAQRNTIDLTAEPRRTPGGKYTGSPPIHPDRMGNFNTPGPRGGAMAQHHTPIRASSPIVTSPHFDKQRQSGYMHAQSKAQVRLQADARSAPSTSPPVGGIVLGQSVLSKGPVTPASIPRMQPQPVFIEDESESEDTLPTLPAPVAPMLSSSAAKSTLPIPATRAGSSTDAAMKNNGRAHVVIASHSQRVPETQSTYSTIPTQPLSTEKQTQPEYGHFKSSNTDTIPFSQTDGQEEDISTAHRRELSPLFVSSEMDSDLIAHIGSPGPDNNVAGETNDILTSDYLNNDPPIDSDVPVFPQDAGFPSEIETAPHDNVIVETPMATEKPKPVLPSSVRSEAHTPAVAECLRCDRAGVTEESRVKHAQAGSTRDISGHVTGSGFAFKPMPADDIRSSIDAAKKGWSTRDPSTTESKQGPLSHTRDYLKQSINHSDASTSDSETRPVLKPVLPIPDDVLDSQIECGGEMLTVRAYLMRAAMEGRNAASVCRTLQPRLKKAGSDARPTAAQIKHHVKTIAGINMSMRSPRDLATAVSRVSPITCHDDKDEVGGTSITTTAKPRQKNAIAHPQTGGKTLPPGYISKAMHSQCLAGLSLADGNVVNLEDGEGEESDIEETDEGSRLVFKYTVYRSAIERSPDDGDAETSPASDEVVGHYFGLDDANNAAYKAAARYIGLKCNFSWDIDEDGMGTYSLSNDNVKVTTFVKRDTVHTQPPPKMLTRLSPRVFEVVDCCDDAAFMPIDGHAKVYTSVEHANSIAARYIIDKVLPAMQPKTPNLTEIDLWKAHEVGKIRDMQKLCDEMHEPIREVRHIGPASKEALWKVEVREVEVVGARN